MSLPWPEQPRSRFDLQRLVHLPLFALSSKSAIAAGIAYWVGAQLPKQLGDYAYYAALGALSVMVPAVTDSIREGMRALAAISAGVALAVLLQWLSWTNWLTVAIVIGLGTAIGGLVDWFGGQRTWVATAGLFVLTTAGPDPTFFLHGYLTQIPLGAAIGVLVNFLLFAPLPLHDVAMSVREMRGVLIAQLRDIADLLDQPEVPEQDAWRESLRDLQPIRERMRAATAQAHRAQEANPRASRRREAFETLARRSEALERCSTLIDVVGDVMVDHQHADSWALGEKLRGATASTLRDLADVLEHVDAADEDGARVSRADKSIDKLLRDVHATDYAELESRYIAGSVALAARRCLDNFGRWQDGAAAG
jgi:uncharacterized membrane protein YgaE (UPF0421/DUF939 family)